MSQCLRPCSWRSWEQAHPSTDLPLATASHPRPNISRTRTGRLEGGLPVRCPQASARGPWGSRAFARRARPPGRVHRGPSWSVLPPMPWTTDGSADHWCTLSSWTAASRLCRARIERCAHHQAKGRLSLALFLYNLPTLPQTCPVLDPTLGEARRLASVTQPDACSRRCPLPWWAGDGWP